VPVTVAEHVEVCAVVIEDSDAETATFVTVGGTTAAEMVIDAVPDFVVSCVETAFTVSAPDPGAVAGAV
jgi:hypothetical protein